MEDCNENKLSNLTLVVLMGLPACGKSTLANKLSLSCTKWYSIVMSFDVYVPISAQAQISETATSVESPQGTLPTNAAKVLRKKFVHCVDTVARFVKEYRGGECADNYLQSLNTILCSFELENLFVSNESFLSNVQNIMKNVIDFYAREKHGKVAIIVDDNNYYHSMRNDFYQVSKKLEIGFCMIHCKVPLNICVQRNTERPSEVQVPHKVLVEMALKFEEPNALQNTCDMYCMQIDLNNKSEINVELLEEIVSNSFSNPLKKNIDRTEEMERERRKCSENEVHQADLVLRKWVNKKLNLDSFSNTFGKGNIQNGGSSSGNFKKNLSKELNGRKKKTLENLKLGSLKISSRVEEDVEFQAEIIKCFENISLE